MFKQIAIIGTTASGKTDLAIQVALKTNAVILSLDSLCIYKEINIASAKPTSDEMRGVRHFGVDVISINDDFSAGKFFELYNEAKMHALNANCALIITGGSGFYLKVMLNGLSPDVPKCQDVPSNNEIFAMVCKIDPDFSQKFSQNDTYRLEKWYQIYSHTNQIPSLWLKQNTAKPIIDEIEIFEICWDVSKIRDRIAKRTQNMIKSGLIDEAKFLFSNFNNDLKPLKSIGLKECKEFLDEKISINELQTLITTHTAQLAKRQRTFNRSAFLNKKSANIDEIYKLSLEALKP